jgi:hypothetical protein
MGLMTSFTSTLCIFVWCQSHKRRVVYKVGMLCDGGTNNHCSAFAAVNRSLFSILAQATIAAGERFGAGSGINVGTPEGKSANGRGFIVSG